MTDTPAAAMTTVEDLAALVEVAPDSTVSRTVLRADGARVVLFAFDTGQELTEHTAAMPVLLSVIDGALDVTADGRTVRLVPGGVVHLGARDSEDDIAVAEAGAFARRARIKLGDDDAFRMRQAERLRAFLRHGFDARAEPWTDNCCAARNR